MAASPRKKRADIPRREQGASQSRASGSDRFNSYISHHRLVARDSFLRLLSTPVPSLMTWLVIGIAMALPGALYVGLSNVESVSRGWDGAAQISLFVHKVVSEQDGRGLARKLEQRLERVFIHPLAAEIQQQPLFFERETLKTNRIGREKIDDLLCAFYLLRRRSECIVNDGNLVRVNC